MIARPRKLARRRGQGMTEYIVLVGLIAILLIAAVLKFSNQINITFVGTTGDVDQMTLQSNLGPAGPNAGSKSFNGKTFQSVEDPPQSNNWVWK